MTISKRSPEPMSRSADAATFGRDRNLLERWRTGDRDAGAELMEHYAAFVRRIANRIGIRAENDFLDLWQELLLRVIQHLPHLQERVHKSFAGYLAWQARDLAMRLRSRRELTLPLPERGKVEPDSAERHEFWRAVAGCEAALAAGERAVFGLRFRDGLGLSEIADRTRSNANAVAQAIFRLVRRMRVCLQRRGFGIDGGLA
ncbi:MAG: sigma-70 family RNA polymerase sigma factor [Planctomycetes bacterium]|nr:sigma-70 family RNA polymerase sigma factor [Planctomycetota bacterium]